jgi:hypothetical protein
MKGCIMNGGLNKQDTFPKQLSQRMSDDPKVLHKLSVITCKPQKTVKFLHRGWNRPVEYRLNLVRVSHILQLTLREQTLGQLHLSEVNQVFLQRTTVDEDIIEEYKNPFAK